MKIIWMRLNPYGLFKDKTIDFGDGKEGFHIVYGYNESGKTTTLRAIKSLFYGIPERTIDGFRFDGNKLRISAKIKNSNGETLVFQRRKGRVRTLLAEDETELDDSILRKFISGIDESSFVNMFGFGRDDLINGGKDIVLGKGDIGQSLFAAGAGINGLRKILEELDAESQNLFKQRSPKSLINKYLSEYEGFKKEIKRISLQPKLWKEHEETLKNAENKKIEINKTIDSLSAKFNRLERINQALPIIAERKDILHKKELVENVLILRKLFKEERVNIVKDLESAQREELKIKAKIENIKENIKKIVIPEQFILNRTSIEDIYVRLGSYDKETKDLPALLEQRRMLLIEAERLLSGLRPGVLLDEATKLVINLQKQKNILSLANMYAKLKEKKLSIVEKIDKITRKKLSSENKLKEIGEYLDTDKLKIILEDIRKEGDIEKNLDKKINEFNKAETLCKIELLKLPLWKGTIEEIEKLSAPLMETIDRYDNEFEKINTEINRIESKIKDKFDNKEKIEIEISGLDIFGIIPTENDLKTERSKRDSGWKLIKQIYIEKKILESEAEKYDDELSLVPAYERKIEYADQIADSLWSKSDKVSKKTILLSNLSIINEDIKSFEIQKTKFTGQREKLIKEWNDLWSDIKIVPLTPREMRSWLQKQQELAKDAEKIRYMKEEIEQIKKRLNENRILLAECLKSASYNIPNLDKDISLAEIIDISLNIIERQENVKTKETQLTQAVKDADEQLGELLAEKEKTFSEILDWKEKWEKEMINIELDPETDPSAAEEFLDKNQILTLKMDEAKKLESRIDSIKDHMMAFESEALNLAEKIMPKIAKNPARSVVSILNSELIKVDKEQVTLENYKAELRNYIEEINEKKDIIKNLQMRLQSLIKEANSENLEQLYEIERKSEEAETLKNNLEQLDKQLRGYSGGMDIEQFIAKSSEIDPDLLPSEVLNVKSEIKRLKDEISKYEQSIGEENLFLKQYDGNSSAADIEEKASSTAAQIEYYSDRYVKLRLAADILKKEIERYRVQNQGPVLKNASKIFSLLTSDLFSGLRTSFGAKDESILVGIRRNLEGIEEEVGVDGMSEGTCDQLYLSLRLASLERYIESNEPMPLIIDDVLVNFDNDRVAACLKIFEEISKKNQVIYFTHHKHILDLVSGLFAPDTPDTLKVHTLML